MDSELHLPGISDEAIRELMDFREKVKTLSRTDLASLARGSYSKGLMPVESVEAVIETVSSLIKSKLTLSPNEWSKIMMENVRLRRLRFGSGAIEQIERRARVYKSEAANYINKLRKMNKMEIKLLKQQMDLSLGSADSLNLPNEEKRKLTQSFKQRIVTSNAVTKALTLGLRNVQQEITHNAFEVEERARRAVNSGQQFLASTKLAKFTANLFESVGGLAASLIGSGGTSAFFHTAGRTAGAIIETGGTVAGEVAHQGIIGGTGLLGIIAGAAIAKVTGDPSIVRTTMQMGGKVGDVLGELVESGVRGISAALASGMEATGAITGKELEAGVKSWIIYDEAKQRLTAMGSGGSLDTARAMGYVSEQAKIAATAYLGTIGDDRMFSEFLSIGRMYGVAPTSLAETLNIYKFAGGTRPGSDTDLKSLYRRTAALTQQPGMGGYGRALEVFQATSKLAGAVGSQVDSMNEEDMTALIGSQAWIGQLGEGYGGLRGTEMLLKLNTAIRGEGGIVARALGIAEVDSAESYIEYQKRKEAGLDEPNNLRRIITRVVREWGKDTEGVAVLREVGNLRTEQAQGIMDLVKEQGLESLTAENLEILAKTDKPRKVMIGAGEAFAVEMENQNITLGEAGHELVFTIKENNMIMTRALIKLLSGDEKGLNELMDAITNYLKLFWDVVKAFLDVLWTLTGIKPEDIPYEWPLVNIIIDTGTFNAEELWNNSLKYVLKKPGLRISEIEKGVQGGRLAISAYCRVHPLDVPAFLDWVIYWAKFYEKETDDEVRLVRIIMPNFGGIIYYPEEHIDKISNMIGSNILERWQVQIAERGVTTPGGEVVISSASEKIDELEKAGVF